MPRVDAVVECPIAESFRARQVAGMFDLPWQGRSREAFAVEVPGLDEDWQIGVIVGPSGSGKSTIARAAFGDALPTTDWPHDAAVVDGFGDASIRDITHTLTAVGFGSPPSWLKPYRVLSQGEQFRCDLARILLLPGELAVCDEFTSVVDRTVAQIGSAAVSRAIRRQHVAKRFVAVTCHYDVLDWLEPDWTVDMAERTLSRRRLRRPPIELEVYRSRHAAWPPFARHHYLSRSLSPYAEGYLATWNDRPVAFAAVLNAIGRTGMKRISRIVVLPDFQGIGIGARLLNTLAQQYRDAGKRVLITTSHPAMIGFLSRSPRWRVRRVRSGPRRKRPSRESSSSASGRAVVSGEFVGDER